MRYLPAFGLTDNPFAPVSWKVGTPGLADNLVTRPLRVDLDAGLRKLYVPQAGPFEAHTEDFIARLEEVGYSKGQQLTGKQSLAILIAGPTGTGKSTLANVMLAEALACVPKVHTITPRRFSGAHEDDGALLKDILDASREGQRGDLFIAVVSELTPPGLAVIEVAYDSLLENGRIVLLIMESESPAFIEDRLHERARIDIQPYDTCYLTGASAEAYVAKRLSVFRDDVYDKLLGSRSLFPFRDQDVAAVGPDATNGDTNQGSFGLRELNKLLSGALRRTARALPPGHDIKCLEPSLLPDYTIDLQTAYARGLPA